jgi:hypothetical protein
MDLEGKNNLNCFNKTSIYSNVLYLLSTTWLIYLYLKDKRLGILVSSVLVFALCFVPYTIGYLPLTMIKLTLIVFGAFLLFLSIVYPCIQNIVNKVLTTFVRLNIFVLIFTTNNIFLILSMIFLTITTPIFTVQNTTVKMESMIIPKDLWVLLSTIGLIIYYLLIPYFCINIWVVIFAVTIPCVMHFCTNNFLESRALCLCTFIMFDIFNNSKKSINDFVSDSKY